MRTAGGEIAIRHQRPVYQCRHFSDVFAETGRALAAFARMLESLDGKVVK
jgi:hypothetical protein